MKYPATRFLVTVTAPPSINPEKTGRRFWDSSIYYGSTTDAVIAAAKERFPFEGYHVVSVQEVGDYTFEDYTYPNEPSEIRVVRF